jgi:hypothetical protein
MKAPSHFLVALVGTLSIALPSKEARALGPVEIEVGAKVGYATNPSDSSINPLGVGIGGRAGVSFRGFYGGLNVVDYLGGNDGHGLSEHALEVGAEVGYAMKLSVLTIRPQVGLGEITFSSSFSGVDQYGVNESASNSLSSFYLEPGVTALVTIGIFYFGADGNALIIMDGPVSALGPSTASTDTVFTLHGQAGLHF